MEVDQAQGLHRAKAFLIDYVPCCAPSLLAAQLGRRHRCLEKGPATNHMEFKNEGPLPYESIVWVLPAKRRNEAKGRRRLTQTSLPQDLLVGG